MLDTFEQRLVQEIALKQSALNHTTTDPSHSNDRWRSSHEGRARVGAGILYPELSRAIVGAAIEVHRSIGPGQLESVYQKALARELALCNIPHRAQAPIALHYKGECVGEFFADFIVDDRVVVELKAVGRLHAVHTAQVLSYLRATNLRLGLLINFDVPVLFHGVRRVIL